MKRNKLITFGIAVALIMLVFMPLTQADFDDDAILNMAAYRTYTNFEVADFDNDGDNDVAYISYVSGKIGWLRNNQNNGTGAIDANGVYWTDYLISDITGGTPRQMTVGDYNGDGHIDVAYIKTTAAVAALCWHINGGETVPSWSSTTSIPAGNQHCFGVSSGDINGDGHIDISVVCAAGSNRAKWCKNNGSISNVGFSAPIDIGTQIVRMHHGPIIIDLDFDGDNDCVFHMDTGAYWYENNGSVSDPGWTKHTIDTYNNIAANLAVADLDNDGDYDVIHGPHWNKNVSTGWIHYTSNFSTSRPIAAYDVNYDGWIDVITYNAYHLNNKNGTFTTGIVLNDGTNGDWTPQFQDIDGDGIKDIIGLDTELGCIEGIKWYRNNYTVCVCTQYDATPHMTVENLNPTLNITVNATGNATCNQTFWSNASGSWAQIGKNNNASGYITNTTTCFNSWDTKYFWSSNLTDGSTWDNDTFWFWTDIEPPPCTIVQTDAQPNVTVEGLNPVLTVTVENILTEDFEDDTIGSNTPSEYWYTHAWTGNHADINSTVVAGKNLFTYSTTTNRYGFNYFNTTDRAPKMIEYKILGANYETNFTLLNGSTRIMTLWTEDAQKRMTYGVQSHNQWFNTINITMRIYFNWDNNTARVERTNATNHIRTTSWKDFDNPADTMSSFKIGWHEKYMGRKVNFGIDDIKLYNRTASTQFRTNASGSWATIYTTNITGDLSYTPSVFNTWPTKYWWSVNSTNGACWNNQTYWFWTDIEIDIETYEDENIGDTNPSEWWYTHGYYKRTDAGIPYPTVEVNTTPKGDRGFFIDTSGRTGHRFFINYTLEEVCTPNYLFYDFNFTNDTFASSEHTFSAYTSVGGYPNVITGMNFLQNTGQFSYNDGIVFDFDTPTFRDADDYLFHIREVFNWSDHKSKVFINFTIAGVNHSEESAYLPFLNNYDSMDCLHLGEISNVWTLECYVDNVYIDIFVYQTNPDPYMTVEGLNPNINININTSTKIRLNQTFWTNASGSWQAIAWNNNISSGPLSNSTSCFTSWATKYWWSSNATDGTTWNNQTYWFWTGHNPFTYLYANNILNLIDYYWNGTRTNIFWDNKVSLNETHHSGSYLSQIYDSVLISTWRNISVDFDIKNLEIKAQTNLSILLHMNDTAGQTTDSTGNGNHGDVYGCIRDATGVFSNGFRFDGTGDYVDIVGGTTNSISGDDTHTIAFWFKPASFGGYPMLVDGCPGLASGMNIEIGAANTMYWRYGANYRRYTLTTTMVADTWYHLACVKTGPGDSGDMYMNGILQNAWTAWFGDMPAGAYDMQIGRYSNVGTYDYRGHIDEFAVWDRTIDQAEVTELYERGLMRLNLSFRTCNDLACAGDSWRNIGNIICNIPGISQPIINMSDIPFYQDEGRWFQYKLDFYSPTVSPVVNRVDINYLTPEMTPPLIIINWPTHNEHYDIGHVNGLNFTITDASDISWYWLSENNGTTYVNYTYIGGPSVTANYTGFTPVIGWNYWTVCANDTWNNSGCETVAFFVNITANEAPINSGNWLYWFPNGTALDIHQPFYHPIPWLNTFLRVNVSDPDGDMMDQSFWTNATGSWELICWNNNTGNATLQNSTSGYFINYDTDYWWSSNVTDGNGNWDNDTVWFRTQINNLSFWDNQMEWYNSSSASWENLINGSIIETTPYIRCIFMDNNTDYVNVTWSENTTGTWKDVNVSGPHATTGYGGASYAYWTYINASAIDSHYWFRCNITDTGGLQQTLIYHFYTGMINVTVYNEYPLNNSVGVERPPINISVYLSTDRNVTIRFCADFSNVHPSLSSDCVDWVNFTDVNLSQRIIFKYLDNCVDEKYTIGNRTIYWTVIVNDSTNEYVNNTYHYTTGGSRFDINNNGFLDTNDTQLVWDNLFKGYLTTDVTENNVTNIIDASLTFYNIPSPDVTLINGTNWVNVTWINADGYVGNHTVVLYNSVEVYNGTGSWYVIAPTAIPYDIEVYNWRNATPNVFWPLCYNNTKMYFSNIYSSTNISASHIIIYDEIPVDEGYGYTINQTVCVSVLESHGHWMDIIIRTNVSGSWSTVEWFNSTIDGRFCTNLTYNLSYGDTVWWSVNVTDLNETATLNETFWFLCSDYIVCNFTWIIDFDNQTIYFNDTSIGPVGHWLWDFGDHYWIAGRYTEHSHPNHTYDDTDWATMLNNKSFVVTLDVCTPDLLICCDCNATITIVALNQPEYESPVFQFPTELVISLALILIVVTLLVTFIEQIKTIFIPKPKKKKRFEKK